MVQIKVQQKVDVSLQWSTYGNGVGLDDGSAGCKQALIQSNKF